MIFSETYFAIHDHLSGYEEYEVTDRQGRTKRVGLRLRDDQGKWWWELRSCAYYHEFSESKVVFPKFVDGAKFAFDDAGYFTNNANGILAGQQPWLTAVLQSRLL